MTHTHTFNFDDPDDPEALLVCDCGARQFYVAWCRCGYRGKRLWRNPNDALEQAEAHAWREDHHNFDVSDVIRERQA